MLQTLLKIGEWQSQGKSNWDRFLEAPKVEYKDKKGNEITNYVLPIVFDLDEKKVIVEKENLREYRDSDVDALKLLKIQGGNNKAIYASVPSGKLIQFYKTFFGKENSNVEEGELSESLKKDQTTGTGTFEQLLNQIFHLKGECLEKLNFWNEKKEVNEIDIRAIYREFNLSINEKIVLVYASVKSTTFDFKIPTSISKIAEYISLLENKFFEKPPDGENFRVNSLSKLCYASGENQIGVQELDLPRNGYSLNAMFVTTTKNFASNFNDKKFSLNYQISKKNQEYLSYASNFLLTNYKTRIANIDHVIIPTFQNSENIDLEMALNGIKKKSDLLFSFGSLENIAKDYQDESDGIFWINFLAFESDGNFFKSTESIKDVSHFHFEKVIKTLEDIDWEFKESSFVNWNSVTTEYGKSGRFNFNTIYNSFPLRKDKEKKNRALDLFKSIMENRPIKKILLFDAFKELMLCHYFERYNSYTNISKSSKDYLGRSIKNGVFKYLAFIQVLKELKLIDMGEFTEQQIEESQNKYDKAIQDFFAKMQLTQDQQAMFYLGRMLNSVEWIQIKKKIKKTVINLVNFNGMGKDDIERLRNDLINKARQHSQVGKVVFTNGRFSELFNYNNWNLQPTEALFFILTGYSFGTNKIEEEQRQNLESEEDINL